MKFISKLLYVSLLLFISFSAFAQDNPKEETLHLIDGSILKGQILEQTDDFTRIKIISGDVLLLNNNLINKTGDTSRAVESLPTRSALHEKGVYNIFSIGLIAGRDAQLEQGLVLAASVLHYVRGYQFNKYLGVGAGAGVDLYGDAFMPIYLDVRGNFNVKNLTLFYSFQGGYAFTQDDFGGADGVMNRGGLMLYPAVGIRIPTHSRTDVLFEFGYRNQWSKREYSWRENSDEITFRRYAFRVGFTF